MNYYNYPPVSRIKNLLVILILSLALMKTASAQTIGSYTFSNTTPGGYTLLTGATSVPSGDDVISGILPIGFTFNFGGTNFTQFKMNSNGWMTFNTTVTSTTNNNALNSAMA